jgi:hypothetical protein
MHIRIVRNGMTVAALFAVAFSVPACETHGVLSTTIDVPISVPIQVNANGSFSTTMVIPYADIAAKFTNPTPPDFLQSLAISARDVSIAWAPSAANTAQSATFTVNSSYGSLSAPLSLTGLSTSVDTEAVPLNLSGTAMTTLTQNLAAYLEVSPSGDGTGDDYVGVQGTVNGGQLAGTLTVKIALTMTEAVCHAYTTLPPVLAPDLPACAGSVTSIRPAHRAKGP